VTFVPDLPADGRPIVDAIVGSIASAVESGRLKPGTRLPTHRAMARRLGISVGTVTRAYARAAESRLVTGEVGRGTFVLPPALRAVEKRYLIPNSSPGTIDFGPNYPLRGPVLEDELLRKTLHELAEDSQARGLLSARPAEHEVRYREAGERWLRRAGLCDCASRIRPTSGFQPAMQSVLRAVARSGEFIIAEELCSPSLPLIASAHGLRLESVGMDAQGMLPDRLEAAIHRRRGQVRAIFIEPSLHSITVAHMPEARRRVIAEIARRHDLVIIELDDVFPFLSEPAPLLASLAPERTILIADVCRALGFNLRTAFVLAPDQYLDALEEGIALVHWIARTLPLEIAVRFADSARADELIAWRRDELRRRYELAKAALGQWPGRGHPMAGHWWIPLPRGWRSDSFVDAARRQDVLLYSTSSFASDPLSIPCGARVSMAAAADLESVERGLERLRDLLRRGPGAAPDRASA